MIIFVGVPRHVRVLPQSGRLRLRSNASTRDAPLQVPGHTLVVPKEQKEKVHEMSPETAAAVGIALAQVARSCMPACMHPPAISHADLHTFLNPKP
jgi:hypothetical protein